MTRTPLLTGGVKSLLSLFRQEMGPRGAGGLYAFSRPKRPQWVPGVEVRFGQRSPRVRLLWVAQLGEQRYGSVTYALRIRATGT